MKTLDTRDLYTRLQELEELRDAVTTAQEELDEVKADPADDEDTNAKLDAIADAEKVLEAAQDEFGTDEQEELAQLAELQLDIGETTMRDGETMIPVDDFEEYAQDFADEMGYTNGPGSDKWPFRHIDWEQAAKELAQDYTTVTYKGEDYYMSY